MTNCIWRLCQVVLFAAMVTVLPRPGWAQSLIVGAKNFTEQYLVTEMTVQLLRSKGFSVDLRAGFTTGGLRNAQERGQIDIVWEYTGTALVELNGVTDRLDADETYARVRALDAEKGLIWLKPSAVNNTYALAMRREDAVASGISSISDLAGQVRSGRALKFATNDEFYARRDGLTPMQRTYGFEFPREDVLRIETAFVYEVLRHSKSVDVGLVFATDGRLAAYDLVTLRDDKGFFPSYSLTPVIRRDALEKHSELAQHLEALSAKLEDGTMSKLNAMVDVEKKTVHEVAASFLRSNGLL